MFRGDRSVPEDSAVRQEGRLLARLCVPPSLHHAHQSRAGSAVRADVGAR